MMNPPFGHLGETSISDFFESYFKNYEGSLDRREKGDFTKFDGNAQGFRVLTKLQILDDLYGLNLTKATLGAYLKYPNCEEIDKNKISGKKRGVFQSEKKYLDIVAKDTGMMHGESIIRHPLSFLVEAADNICYRVMDIEDGFNKEWFSFDELVSHFKDSEIGENLVAIQKDKKGTASKIAAFRLLVMNKLITKCVDNFLTNIDKITSGEYNCELIEDENKSKLDTELKEVCQKWIFPKREVVSMELKGDAVIKGLLNKYTEFIIQKPKKYLSRALPLISNSVIKTALMENGFNSIDDFDKLSEYFKLRVIVDYISGMTDQYALSQFRIFHG